IICCCTSFRRDGELWPRCFIDIRHCEMAVGLWLLAFGRFSNWNIPPKDLRHCQKPMANSQQHFSMCAFPMCLCSYVVSAFVCPMNSYKSYSKNGIPGVAYFLSPASTKSSPTPGLSDTFIKLFLITGCSATMPAQSVFTAWNDSSMKKLGIVAQSWA